MRGMVTLQAQLQSGHWHPSRSNCFIATSPKAREIHAPDFADRVMHHWLVPQLEAIYEPSFIHDSYANRTDRGTHAAVRRLQQFVRQVQSGQGGGHYLQLDIHNFFNSIHRPTLWSMLKKKLIGRVPTIALQATHALIKRSPLAQGVTYCATDAERAKVPPHKRLENAAPGCGLPIGNLSSQFFANVYLNELDQFIKHTLKVQRYLRYVDDFVLVHESREQLQTWLAQIEQFLHEKLQLKLKADIKLRPLTAGCDFLGYVIYPTHTRVRKRVVNHARAALSDWYRTFASETPDHIQVTPAALRELQSKWASYQGHFVHARSWRLQQQFYARFPWLAPLTQVRRRFRYDLEAKRVGIRVPLCA